MYSFKNLLICGLVCLSVQIAVVNAANQKKSVLYWGQNSIGSFTNDPAAQEKPLRTYCSDPNIDIIVVGFVYLFPYAPGDTTFPGMNFANHCEVPFTDDHPFLLNCTQNVAPDVSYCQSIGKTILMSFGGGIGPYGFSSADQGTAFATKIWNMFLGGSGDVRPFGSAIFDGVDLDIEGGADQGYVTFVNTLRGYFATANKKYYITAAPQCFYPDRLGPAAGSTLSTAWFDYIWIQFYNNHCGVNEYPQNFNFALWAAWAALNSVNPNVQIFIGIPASEKAAASGFVGLSTVQLIANAMNIAFPRVYGGIMIWDASTSDDNNNFASTVGAFVHTQVSFAIPSSPPVINVPSTPPVIITPPSPATTGMNAVPVAPITSGMNAAPIVPITSGMNAAPIAPITSGMNAVPVAPVTSGMNAAPVAPMTTGAKPLPGIPVKPITSGIKAATTGKTRTGNIPSIVTTGIKSATNLPTPCIPGNMVCASSETYRICDRGTWAPEQSCQVGLTCTPSGPFIYCT